MISLAKYIWYYYNHRVRFVMYQSHLTNSVCDNTYRCRFTSTPSMPYNVSKKFHSINSRTI